MRENLLVIKKGKGPGLSVVPDNVRGSADAQLNGATVRGGYRPEDFVGQSPQAGEIRELLRRLTEASLSALIIGGETGTGKGLAARILHHSGPRADGPLIEVNCAALPRELAESELFGHEAGAFTGARNRHRGYLEQADGGTLFLDEIGELDTDLQAKLLTVIEDRRVRRVGGETAFDVNVRIIAASNRPLETQVREQRFRSDLFHRLSVFRVMLPSLRERIADLEQLVPLIVEEFNARADKRIRRIPRSFYRALSRYDWPGNVRELRNVLERAVLLSQGEQLEERWLQLEPLHTENSRVEVDGNRVIIPLDGSMALDEMDSCIIQTALERNHYNVTATARALGATRETLRYRIQKYNLRAGSGAQLQ